MADHISSERLEEKLRKFIDQPVTLLRNHCDFNFCDEVIRFPIETIEGHVIESTFCHGYQDKKYLAALSAQAGCGNQCKFCELAGFGLKKNLSSEELVEQLRLVLHGADKRGYNIFDKPIKATFVMGGDPLNNCYFAEAVNTLAEKLPLQLKISTLLSASEMVRKNYQKVVSAAKNYPHIVQMQISLNSTDEKYRQSLSPVPLAGFAEIREAGEIWKNEIHSPRKVNLTFTVNEETPLDPKSIARLLPPELFAVRLRELVPTSRGESYGLRTVISGQIEEAKKQFEDFGYDLISGSPGMLEQKFKLAPGEMIRLYSQMKNR